MTVDYLSCGTCFVTFRLSDISLFIEHKKSSCYSKSSFTPISENDKYASSLSSSTSTLETPLLSLSSPFPLASTSESDNIDTGILKCAQCFRQFTTPWPFLLHVQIEHQLIFINCIEKFSKKFDEQCKGNVDEIMNDNDQCDNNVLHTIDKLLSEKVSDYSLTSDDIVCTYNSDNPNTSTQTHLTGIKQQIIPHRKRKYANCCFNNEPNITCSKLNSINCSNVKDCNLAPHHNDNVNDTRSNRYTDPIPRRYTCRECGISFHQNVHLRKHIMVQHTKVKPYHCPYCEYTTVEKSHLTVHIRIHTGERPYSCRECNYSSAQNCTLKSHYLRKHPTNLIACDYCSELFFTELELSKHHRSCRVAVRQ
ncbi:Zinc finger protein [Schistosoma japonicum]|uniref:Zinc finger protein n=1 Tax=Schistosoma japonicum TaxID=6182 RepID=A0A4Z2DER7_SCHJA|nr:Zinc finger protein [Schistosoma japonicum]